MIVDAQRMLLLRAYWLREYARDLRRVTIPEFRGARLNHATDLDLEAYGLEQIAAAKRLLGRRLLDAA